MGSFFVLYALTISIELMLSLVMAIFLYLILAPTGSRTERQPETPQHPRLLARTVEGALGDAFATVSEGHNDLATLTNARMLLQQYQRERRDAAQNAS
ncbi:MAG TPA: hypothetical protein VEX37_13530 [Thermomicrobiales bacterium]|nr:hypothetical protein [Thermomicrobiales bacterium]